MIVDRRSVASQLVAATLLAGLLLALPPCLYSEACIAMTLHMQLTRYAFTYFQRFYAIYCVCSIRQGLTAPPILLRDTGIALGLRVTGCPDMTRPRHPRHRPPLNLLQQLSLQYPELPDTHP